jgi:acetyltransferase-like isoleucine patch superfamily enzyme
MGIVGTQSVEPFAIVGANPARVFGSSHPESRGDSDSYDARLAV